MKPAKHRGMVLWETGVRDFDLVVKVRDHCSEKAAIRWQVKDT